MYSVVVLQVILLFCGEGGKQLYSWDYLKYIVILIAPGLSRRPFQYRLGGPELGVTDTLRLSACRQEDICGGSWGNNNKAKQ